MWQAPDLEDQNGIIAGYSINLILVSTGQSIQMMSTTTNLFLDDLQPFTTYTFRVAAMTSVGVGPYSIATSIMTEETGRFQQLGISLYNIGTNIVKGT